MAVCKRGLGSVKIGRAKLDQNIGFTTGDHVTCGHIPPQSSLLGIGAHVSGLGSRQQRFDIQPGLPIQRALGAGDDTDDAGNESMVLLKLPSLTLQDFGKPLPDDAESDEDEIHRAIP